MSPSDRASARSSRLVDSPLLWATVAIYSLGLARGSIGKDLITVASWVID